jgi:putative SOS response-associated peptidase YedK
MMTRAANADVAHIHHRMPVILNVDERESSLAGGDDVECLGEGARLRHHQVARFGTHDEGRRLIEATKLVVSS